MRGWEGFGLKGTERPQGQANGCGTKVTEEIGECWHDSGGFNVQIAKRVCSSLSNEMVWALEVSQENRYCWSCVGAEFDNCDCRLSGHSIVTICRGGGESMLDVSATCRECAASLFWLQR